MTRVHRCLICLSLILFAACSSKEIKPSCETFDWYETGRRDGSNGRKAEEFSAHAGMCLGRVDDKQQEQYLSGRKAGLISYCTAASGWSAGRSGQTYSGVCPQNQERPFLKNYNIGLRVYSLLKQNARISREIDQISTRLRVEDLDFQQKDQLNSKLAQLKNDREGNSEKMSSMQNSVSQ